MHGRRAPGFGKDFERSKACRIVWPLGMYHPGSRKSRKQLHKRDWPDVEWFMVVVERSVGGAPRKTAEVSRGD